MSPKGRKASLPPADHTAPEVLDPLDGLTVHHRNRDGHVRDYGFSALPVAETLQHSLAVLFAARARRWGSHTTSRSHFDSLRAFAAFVSEQDRPPCDLDELTGSLMKAWWLKLKGSQGGRETLRLVASLLHDDPRLQSGQVAEELARRVPVLPRKVESYESGELDGIKLEARRMFRAAWLRIEENAAHLQRWHEGAFAPDTTDAALGEALDLIARTGDLPRYVNRDIKKYFLDAVGGQSVEATWKRLFLDRMEATALGVLLVVEFGWNLSVINVMPTPRAAPDQGRDGHPTYKVKVRKHKGDRFETENVTDTGAGTPGRLLTQALQATRFARALAHDLAPDADRFLAWRAHYQGHPRQQVKSMERRLVVGPIRLGLSSADGTEWGKLFGWGSPFQRGRRTVVVDRGEPTQHTQSTHERKYVLPDQRVQREAAPVIAAGAASALRHAQETVKLAAQLVTQRNPDDQETATADCSDTSGSPVPLPDGGCGASFLLCLACENARVHDDHHPRLVALHRALGNARSVLPQQVWDRRWSDPAARLEDLKRKIGDGRWQQAADRITDLDREIVDDLLNGDLNL